MTVYHQFLKHFKICWFEVLLVKSVILHIQTFQVLNDRVEDLFTENENYGFPIRSITHFPLISDNISQIWQMTDLPALHQDRRFLNTFLPSYHWSSASEFHGKLYYLQHLQPPQHSTSLLNQSFRCEFMVLNQISVLDLGSPDRP